MEPRQYKTLSEVLLVIGIIVASIGVAMLCTMDDNTPGAIVLIIGCGMALISLPTFMILMMLTSANIIQDKK